MAETSFKGTGCIVRGVSDPKLMRVIITVPHDPALIEEIESWVDSEDDPEPVSVKIEPLQGRLPLQ